MIFNILRRRQANGEISKNHFKLLQSHFDADFYIKENPELALTKRDALDHYLASGWLEGRDPAASFSNQFYLDKYPDVQYAGINPLVHYALHGKKEGRATSPEAITADTAPEAGVDELKFLLRDFFDEKFYRQRYGSRLEGRDPFLHFMVEGWHVGNDPSPNFSTKDYLEKHADVRDAGTNPLLHYVTYGRWEGRSIGSDQAGTGVAQRKKTELLAAQVKTEDDSKHHEDAVAGTVLEWGPGVDSAIKEVGTVLQPHFDRAFYTAKYPDVLAANVDPLFHYCMDGWRELRDPTSDFSTKFYLESNPDVKDANINPFFHYVVAGKREGRRAVAPGGYKTEMLRALQPLQWVAERWIKDEVPEAPLRADMLKKAILQARLAGQTKLIISISHDDYRTIPGGVQLCIQREEGLAGKYASAYLHLRPWQPLPYLARMADADPLVVVVLNGKELGVCPTSKVADAIETLESGPVECQVVVHHMLGHSPEKISDLVTRLAKSECWLWVHDFFSLCPSYALQRNTVSFCGAPPPTSNSCSLCVYGEERLEHIARIEKFHETVRAKVLSPSKVTENFWRSKNNYLYSSIETVPHMTIDWKKNRKPNALVNDEAVHVGFLGTPAPHKGWNVFADLVAAQKRSGFYKFRYFGTSKASVDGVEETKVQVSVNDLAVMINAVSDHAVDFVIHWASWPETFSFSVHEALAGGAFVITNRISGNVAAVVEKTKRGLVFDTEKELLAFFESGAAIDLALRVRKDRQQLAAACTWSEISLERINVANFQ